jgi:HSP20 family protein
MVQESNAARVYYLRFPGRFCHFGMVVAPLVWWKDRHVAGRVARGSHIRSEAMTRTMTPWTRFPRTVAELETEFPKWMTEFFTPETGMFGKFDFLPEVNVAETEKAVEVTMELPGMKPEEVKVEILEGRLWVTGEKKEEQEEKGKTFHRIERKTGQFRRVLPLPTKVQAERVEAKMNEGVLKIVLPKTEEARPTAIPVK